MDYIYRNIENIPVDIEYPDDFENTVTNTLCKPIIYNRFKRVAHCPKFGETFDYVDTIRKGDFLPFRGEGRTYMPHTCYPQGSGKTYVWMFYRNETIYFVAAYASWIYDGEEVESMRDITQIYIEQIVCISREEQFMYAYQGAYRGGWTRCQDGSIHLIDKGCVHNLVTIEQLKNTFLKYVDVDIRFADYMIKEAAICAKYPQIEFIKKSGLEEIVERKILIRPLRNRTEFNKEGRSNHNCVASYYERATEGRTSIFVLREIGDEEQSFVTVEIDLKRGELKQCYGQGNRLPEKEVTEWVEKWLVKMIKKLRKADKATLKGAA